MQGVEMELTERQMKFATPRERKLLKAWKREGSAAKAAAKLGLSKGAVMSVKGRIKRRWQKGADAMAMGGL